MATRPPPSEGPKDIINDAIAYIVNFIASLVSSIFERMNSFIASLSNYFSNLVSQFVAFFNNLLTQVTSFLSGILAAIQSTVEGLVAQVGQALSGILSTIEQALSQIVDQVGGAISALVDRIGSFLDGFLERMQQFFLDAWEAIRNATVAVIDSVRAYAADIFDAIRGLVSTVVDVISSFVRGVVQSVTGLIEQGLAFIAGVAQTVQQAVVGFVQVLVDAAVAAYQAGVQRIEDGFELLFQGAQSIIATVEDRISQLREAFTEAAGRIVQKLGNIADEEFKPIRDQIKSYVDPWVQAIDIKELQKMTGELAQITSSHTLALNSRDEMAANIQRMMPTSYLGQWIFTLVFNVFSAMAIFSGVTSANAQMILQEFAVNFHYQLLSPADSSTAWRHGNLARESARHNIVRQGYSEDDADKILDSSSSVPSLQDMVSMWLRGIMSEDDLGRALFQQGYDGPWPARIMQAAQIIPPVQDLISMAVREAFSPEIAARFGQYEDFPEAFASFAQKQGLSEEWAKRYWAAHWGLPSVQMGYEMLHRGAIKEEDLDLLLRAQDVMPFWRDKLKAISFSPYTRVDIRRMHQIGVLNEEQVRRAYLDLGYDGEKAEQLTRFTILLNKGAPVEDEQDLGKLSRTAILGFYEDGVLNRSRAQNLLVSIGLTSDAASLYLDAEDFARQRKERKADITLTIEQAESGALTWEQAQDHLNRLGLTTLEVQKALADLLRAQLRKTKLPTQNDGESFFVAGIIDEAAYNDLLGRLGYAPVWRTAYVKKAKAKRDKPH